MATITISSAAYKKLIKENKNKIEQQDISAETRAKIVDWEKTYFLTKYYML